MDPAGDLFEKLGLMSSGSAAVCAVGGLVWVGAASYELYGLLKRDRWAAVRTSRFAWVRWQYKKGYIYAFARKLDRAVAGLEPVGEATACYPGGEALVDRILREGPDTFQKKQTNRRQIHSLLECVVTLLPAGATELVLDLGAGKALLTRAVYEALGRRVPVAALDCRKVSQYDRLYDPTAPAATGEAPYTRIVTDVRKMTERELPIQGVTSGSAVCISKHLCGGATCESLKAVCSPPLAGAVGACCIAPCCHQKTKKRDYCNAAFLAKHGFGKEHVGLRGGTQDNDYRTLLWLIQISKAPNPASWEHRKRVMVEILGVKRCQNLGVKARRLFEEGRLEYLRTRGFDAKLVRYCDAATTPDNLAIVARRSAPLVT